MAPAPKKKLGLTISDCRAIRAFLGLPKSTPISGLLNEINMLSPRSRTQIKMVQQFYRVLKMDDSRLTKKILKYDLVFGQNGAKSCWSSDIKDIFTRNNLSNNFSTFPFNIKHTIDDLTQFLLSEDQLKWNKTVNTEYLFLFVN